MTKVIILLLFPEKPRMTSATPLVFPSRFVSLKLQFAATFFKETSNGRGQSPETFREKEETHDESESCIPW